MSARQPTFRNMKVLIKLYLNEILYPMTLRTFWTIFIKILGIFLIIDSVPVVLQAISTLFFTYSQSDQQMYMLLPIATTMLTVGIYLIIIKYCIYDPTWLIDKLKLDQGFHEENLNLNLDKTMVLSITTIVIGGLLFVENLPFLCKQLFVFYQEEALSGKFGDKPSTGWVIICAVKVIAGYLIMTNHKAIVDFVDKKSRNNETNVEL
jgi:hypothetical protein